MSALMKLTRSHVSLNISVSISLVNFQCRYPCLNIPTVSVYFLVCFIVHVIYLPSPESLTLFFVIQYVCLTVCLLTSWLSARCSVSLSIYLSPGLTGP